MNLIIIHKNEDHKNGKSRNLLQFALTHEPLAGLLLDGMSKYIPGSSAKNPLSYTHSKHNSADIIHVIPGQWDIAFDTHMKKTVAPQQCPNTVIRYDKKIQIAPDIINRIESNKSPESWTVVSNGRFATQINNELFTSILNNIRADIVAVNADCELLNKCEKIRLIQDSKIAGFRRLYSDSMEFVPAPNNWPHHLFIKNQIFVKLFNDGILPESFSCLVTKCRTNAVIMRTIKIGGTALDLETETGLLEFYKTEIETSGETAFGLRKPKNIPENSRCIGKVLLCNDVQLGQNVTIVGPSIICDNVHIGQGAVINSSIIGPDVHVPQSRLINNTILTETTHNVKTSFESYEKTACTGQDIKTFKNADTTYRNWPKFSYVRCIKRIADCILAVIVLLLFAPVIPFIALAIKLSSPGPVFFMDKRQGLHGREFNCLKFRTMIVGAEKIQEKLKSASHVDGPQFKMVNDPRLSAVGAFLRETYIDEIPQFFNVLLGQMSVVGPRPSPEPENTLCPYWRDARLSVRPGITGLWQIYRTRVPMKDFQEWILYDTEYVRNLSFKTDMSICWKTTKKLFEEFINQF
jgi:lipopolysaccharide/colanic/teichoic acid biosynthesis glycosyltransferase